MFGILKGRNRQVSPESSSTAIETVGLQKAFIDYVESIVPAKNKNTQEELTKVQSAFDEKGFWQAYDEWRISTSFDTRIDKEEVKGKTWYKVRVECDGQEFTCRCPNLEKAFLFSKFYRRLIVDQFYSVGPPWA